MKQLIVNADDLGADEARNSGIFDAIRAGAVTSVSLLANGAAFEDAVRGIWSLDRYRFSIGIHLNLSEGTPLSPGLKILTGPKGHFWGKEAARRLLVCDADSDLTEEIRRELSAQISVLNNTGFRIDHLDGHQHVHIFPSVIRLALDAADAHAIPWIRIPEEPAMEFQTGSPSLQLLEEAQMFSRHAAAARHLLSEFRVTAIQNFRGLYMKGNLPLSSWAASLESLPDGITEFMVHPGRAANSASGPFSGFSTPDREKELESLTDGHFQQALLKAEVELISFPEAPL